MYTAIADSPISELTDISGIVLDNGVPLRQRSERLMELVKNPRQYRVGTMSVTLEFTEDAPAFQVTLTDYLKRKKSGM